MQQDPEEYVDGLNKYETDTLCPVQDLDPTGLEASTTSPTSDSDPNAFKGADFVGGNPKHDGGWGPYKIDYQVDEKYNGYYFVQHAKSIIVLQNKDGKVLKTILMTVQETGGVNAGHIVDTINISEFVAKAAKNTPGACSITITSSFAGGLFENQSVTLKDSVSGQMSVIRDWKNSGLGEYNTVEQAVTQIVTTTYPEGQKPEQNLVDRNIIFPTDQGKEFWAIDGVGRPVLRISHAEYFEGSVKDGEITPIKGWIRFNLPGTNGANVANQIDQEFGS
jgi:hypothetical protein